MKELLNLKSFQQILFFIFLSVLIIGVQVTLFGFNLHKFKSYLLIIWLPTILLIVKGLYKNSTLLFKNLKTISTKK